MNLLDGLVEFWKFNNTLVGLNGHRWQPNHPAVDSDTPGLSGYAPGKIEQGWLIYAATNYGLKNYDLGNPFGDGDWTVAWWQRAHDRDNGGSRTQLRLRQGTATQLMIQADAPKNENWSFGDFEQNLLRVTWPGLTNVYQRALPAASGDWDCFCVCYERAKDLITGFINNVAAGSDSVPSSPPTGLIDPYLMIDLGCFGPVIDCLGIWSRAWQETDRDIYYNSGAGWEPTGQPQTLRQHLIVSPSGIIQPVGSSIVVPGWV